MSVSPKLVHRKQACTHCGTSFHPSTPEEEFCCSGCAFVHDMITNEGLERFYDLKGNATTFSLAPGAHRVAVQINGQIRAEATFELLS